MAATPYHADSTKRQHRRYRQRPHAFVPILSGAGAQLAAMPAEAEVAYLVGPRPASWHTWALAGLADHDEAGRHYFDGAPVLRYTHAGRSVALYTAAVWFGAGRYTAAEAADAFDVLGRAIRARFGHDVAMLATPATMGRDLFLRSVPRERDYPVLDSDTQTLLRSTSGQGRIELLAPASPTLPGLYEYDGRLMYAALAWGLPDGTPRFHLTVGGAIDDQAPSWQRVAVRVPRDWRERFGLLGVRDDSGAGWRYPREPGETFGMWATGAEVLLARRCGWEVEPREAIVWEPRTSRRGPLETWTAKLVALRREVTMSAAQYGGSEHATRVAALARDAVRAMLLHGIGAFHGAPHRITRSVSLLDAYKVPEGAAPRLEGDHLVWTEHAPAAWPAMSHPEWSTQIWGRARARLLAAPMRAGALHRTAGQVVAFRTDAIYLTAPQEWRDDGAVGRYRLKRRRGGLGAPWPETHRELLELRELCESVDSDEWRRP